MASLRYVDDAGQLQVRSIDSEQFVIGRAATAQLVLDDETVSREHVRIELEAGGRFRVRDLGSRNKTFLNGEQIAEALLTSGDIIRAGSRVVEFLEERVARDSIGLEFLTPDRSEPPHCEWLKVKAPLSLGIAQVEQLATLIADHAVTARLEDLADLALGQVLLDLQAERGFIALRGESKTDLRPIAQRSLRKPQSGSLTPVSQWFTAAPLLQAVAGRYPQTADQLGGKLGFATAGIVAPLVHRGESIGVIYLDRPSAKKPFPASGVPYLLAVGAFLGTAMSEAARRLSRSAARDSAAWVASLRRVQSQVSPMVVGEAFDVASRCSPGRVRCGDVVDVIELSAQRIAVLLVDGGGAGMAGVAQAGAIRAGIRSALSVSEDALSDPGTMLSAMNRMIAGSRSRQVIPFLYAGIDLAMGRLSYVNAGGIAPVLMVAPGRLLTLDQPSLIAGVDPNVIYEPTRVELPDAFRLVCFSGGVTEAANAAGEALGEQAIHDALLEREAFAAAGEVVARVFRVHAAHLGGAHADDDATVLVIGRSGAA